VAGRGTRSPRCRGGCRRRFRLPADFFSDEQDTGSWGEVEGDGAVGG